MPCQTLENYLKVHQIIISLLICCAFSLPAAPAQGASGSSDLSAVQLKPIVIGAFIYPPAAYLDDTGTLTGVTVEAVRTILQNMGYKPSFKVMPLKRCLADMQDGTLPVMLPCIVNIDRLEYMRYSEPVYYIDSVLWKNGQDLTGCWDNFEDLRGLRIGASNGYAYGPEWDGAVKRKVFKVDIVASSNPEFSHFAKLVAGRTDMFICGRTQGEFIKKRYAPRFDNIYPCPKGVGPIRSFNMPISRKYFMENGLAPDAFLSRFNQELDSYLGIN